MNYHLRKYQAHLDASQREVNAAELSRTRGHSSGHRFKAYGVRRAFFILWEVYEKKS